MAHFLHHTVCPKCRENGNDRTGNNLGVYSDGSEYCFKCGYTRFSQFDKEKLTGSVQAGQLTGATSKLIVLPNDATADIPRIGRDYLSKYSLTVRDVTDNFIMWSESYQRLLFPYFDDKGLLGWQGRYLGLDKDKPKWYSQGDLKSILHILGNVKSNICCVVEDTISAIKVGHNPNIAVSPLFGSFLSTQRILQLKLFYDTIFIWLDPDMRLKVIKFSKQVQHLGLNVKVIYSDKDPKEYNDEEITNYLRR